MSDENGDQNPEVKILNKAKFTLAPVRGAAANLAIDIARQCNLLYNSDRIKQQSPIRSNNLELAIEKAGQDRMQVLNDLVRANEEFQPSVMKMFVNDQVTELFKSDVTKKEVEMEYHKDIGDGTRMAAQIEHGFHIQGYARKAGIKQMTKYPPTVFKKSMMRELLPKT